MKPAPSLSSPLPTERLRVLVVEDEALIAENLRLTLEDLGFEALPACYTYAEAHRRLLAPPSPAQPRPDVVLLDLNLGHPDPACTGLALARLLRTHQGPPFIFLTAYSDLETIRQATAQQPGGYLIKPASGPALFAALQTVLNAPLPPAPGLIQELNATPATTPPAYFFVRIGERMHRLQWQDVEILEAGKNYVTLRVAGLRAGYPLRGSLSYVHQQLVPQSLQADFVRVSRLLAVNRRFITSFDAQYVYLGEASYELTTAGYQELLGAVQ